MNQTPVLVLALFGAASAFHAVAPRTPALRATRLSMEDAAPTATADVAVEEEPAPPAPPAVVYSESMPFLVKRKALEGYVGDVGFDPLGFSEILPMDWLREAELKHCRVSMLAFVGLIFTDFYTLPGYEFTTLEAHDAGVANGSMSQLLLWLGMLEFFLFHCHRSDAPRLGPRAWRLRL